jgi:N-acetylglucosaminyl-diphospho-decaprenol L-rhamnosyltransferase
MKDRICAIILDYRAADKTATCLRSLNGQGLTTVYLVDNSASESASAALQESVDRVRATVDFDIVTLNANENLGFAKGVNLAVRHDFDSPSPHDYYLLLNNDAVAGPSVVRGLIKAIERDSRIALVSPRIVSSDPKHEYGIWYHRYTGLLLSRPRRFCFHYFTGCCLLFRKELAEAGEIFDERFFMYGEDAELGWRLTRQEKQMLCVEEVFVEHEYGPSVDRSSFFYEYHMARAHLLLTWQTWKHPAEIPLLLVFKFIGLSLRAIARCWRYRTTVPLAALSLAWLPIKTRPRYPAPYPKPTQPRGLP